MDNKITTNKEPIHCPICNKPTEYSTPPIGTFCSTRCQMVDLSKWLNEEYVVSEPLQPHHFEDSEDQG
jgi:endogenous inhibitor of DNA gyrase (YacG/DUF329 family)